MVSTPISISCLIMASDSSTEWLPSSTQGITWVWLLGQYYDALKNLYKVDKTRKDELKLFITTTRKTFRTAVLDEGCIGSISEIYDSKTPYLPRGTFSQAWSVAEILRISYEYRNLI